MDLKYVNIANKRAQYLANVLKQNKVRSTTISLASSLYLMQTVIILHLERNSIDAQGIQHLANAFSENTVKLIFGFILSV